MNSNRFTVENTTVRNKNLYMMFYGQWYVIDVDISDFKILDDGKRIMYKDCERYTKSVSWDDEIDEIRVRMYKNKKYKNEYLLTIGTIRDFSSYICGIYNNVKNDINYLQEDTINIQVLEAQLWGLLNSIK